MEQHELLGKSKVYLPSLEYGQQFQPKVLNTNRKIDFDLLAVSPNDGKRAFTKYNVLPPIGHSFCDEITGNTRDTHSYGDTRFPQSEQGETKKSHRTRRHREWKKSHSTCNSNSHLGLRRDLFQTDRRTSATEALIIKDDCPNSGDDNKAFELDKEESKEILLRSQENLNEASGNNLCKLKAEANENNIEDGDVDENEQEKPKFSLWKTKMLRIMNRYKEKFQNVDGEWKENGGNDASISTSERSNDRENNNNNQKAGVTNKEDEIKKENGEEDFESDDIQQPSVSRRDAVCRTNDEQLHYFLLLRNLRDFGLI